MYKRLVIIIALSTFFLTGIGCGGNQGGASNEAGGALRVGLVADQGGVNDGSFNEAADRGIKKAEENLGIKRINPIESLQQEQYQPNLKTMAGAADLTVGAGFIMASSMKAVSEQLPDKKFLIVDTIVDSPNVVSYVFKEQEGAYLGGVMAGVLTKTNKIGFIGGKEGDVIERFEAGFAAGVASVNPEAAKGLIPASANSHGAYVKYIDSFSDQSKAKEAANILYNSGVDIIFHSAGGAGQGLFLAAKERGKYAIGVDLDQAKLLPDYGDVILFSVIKKVDEAVFSAIENLQKGEFKGGSTIKLGVKEDAIGISETLNKAVTDKAKDARTRAEEVVRSESLIIPDTLDKLLKFEAPSLKEAP
ncbi:BMP family lipoprotein [Alloiococcus sp. CFN-8]|uniref:BMP family lipoprotein n=1 Tax=Alloiococcus sp. CFN-8 TaxID=3416081 RepID=UPI003CF48749